MQNAEFREKTCSFFHFQFNIRHSETRLADLTNG